ncbi:hypothetical protein A2U01_0093652, partial [Trifolium medium]|nr:hypothetical protein [Trifolium medium]
KPLVSPHPVSELSHDSRKRVYPEEHVSVIVGAHGGSSEETYPSKIISLLWRAG